MKGIIFYFSGTGNTKQMVTYLADRTHEMEFDVHDMRDSNMPEVGKYDLLGFASYAQSFVPPEFVVDYMKHMQGIEGKYVFACNTFGLINGNTTEYFVKLLNSKGCKVIHKFALHTTESSPVMIKYGIRCMNAPGKREFMKFEKQIMELEFKIKKIIKKEEIFTLVEKESKLFAALNHWLTKSSIAKIGKKSVDMSRCISCQLCVKKCPYNAIIWEGEHPVFEEKLCKNCFICYNVCPKQAIYTKRFGESCQYKQKFGYLNLKTDML